MEKDLEAKITTIFYNSLIFNTLLDAPIKKYKNQLKNRKVVY